MDPEDAFLANGFFVLNWRTVDGVMFPDAGLAALSLVLFLEGVEGVAGSNEAGVAVGADPVRKLVEKKSISSGMMMGIMFC